MNNDFFIVGAGGHLRSLNVIIQFYRFKICGVYDKSFKKGSVEKVCEYPIIGDYTDIKKNNNLILAIGNNYQRASVYEDFLENIHNGNLKHPLAKMEDKVLLGESNQIFANSYINGYCKIGKDNIINTGSIIEHEVVIGNHNHISIGSVIGGRVQIGNFCFVGAGSVIIDKIKITDNVIIGANSVVIRDIVEPGTYVGNPAKRIK